MTDPIRFAVLTEDRRSELLCSLLSADGYPVQLLRAPDRWNQENLPPPGTWLIAARASPELRQSAEVAGFRLVVYGSAPDFMERNGVITAECALQVAMRHRERILRESHGLVIGLGNIGRPLAAMLQGLAVPVAAAVRRQEQLEAIRAAGMDGLLIESLASRAGEFDLIFNTAPAMVLPEGLLRKLPPKAMIVDLASAPGGVDREAAKVLGIKTIQALRLPGLMAPVSGALAIRDTVYRLYREEIA